MCATVHINSVYMMFAFYTLVNYLMSGQGSWLVGSFLNFGSPYSYWVTCYITGYEETVFGMPQIFLELDSRMTTCMLEQAVFALAFSSPRVFKLWVIF